MSRGNGHTLCGIPSIGEIPWGSHFCHFYRSKADLVDSLVPYFEAGLRSNERCLWITAEPFPAADARAELGKRVPGLSDLIDRQRITILDFGDWYESSSGEDVKAAWLRHEAAALADGFDGLRVAGNAGFLTRDRWSSFADYERKVNRLFQGRRIVALCSHNLLRCGASDVFEVVRNHGFTIDRHNGRWEVIESAHRG